MLGALTRWLFKLWGWRIVGPVPTVPKGIWVVAPHATYWDFPVGLGIRPTVHIWIQFLAKSSLFTWYSGWLFRALGGKPHDQTQHRARQHDLPVIRPAWIGSSGMGNEWTATAATLSAGASTRISERYWVGVTRTADAATR